MGPDERPRKIRKIDDDIAGPNETVGETPDSTDITRKPLDGPADPADQSEPDLDSAEIEDAVVVKTSTGDQIAQTGGASISMSKNQLKKLRKKQEWEAGRDYRKAKKKQKLAEKKERKRAEKQELGEQPSTTNKTPHPRRAIRLPVTFIIDCGFDRLMNEKERISLGSQLTRAYSDNSKAPYQAHLVVSSWSGGLKERFDTVLSKHYENWKGIEFEQKDFVFATERAKERMSGPKGGKLSASFGRYAEVPGKGQQRATRPINGAASPQMVGESGGDRSQEVAGQPVQSSSESRQQNGVNNHSHLAHPLPEPEVIYLTSDSPHTLDDLKPYSTYIVGGLVDKNRHKGICYKTACEKGIKTAKLPIGQYMEMQSRFVLATNHVVEIMICWLECGDWGEAFMKVIPKRKGGKLKFDGGPSNDEVVPDDGSTESADELVADAQPEEEAHEVGAPAPASTSGTAGAASLTGSEK